MLVKYHWLREKVEEEVFHLEYVPTAFMRSDVLTKPLESTAHQRVISLLGLVSLATL